MLTDKQIEAVYNQIRWRIDVVNTDYLKKVAEQIKALGKLNPSSIRKLAQMRIYGANARKVKKALAKALNSSVADVQKLFEQAAEEEYTGVDFLNLTRGRRPIPLKQNGPLQGYIKALTAQTEERLLNYANTTNIDTNYQEVVSDAIDAVSRGVTDYNSAIRDSMRKLGGDGLRVTYESGYTRRLDSAIRQNILDGTKQIAQKAQQMIGEEIGADGVELSAHPYSALDHEPAQGRQYSLENYQRMQRGESFQDVDGNVYTGFKRPIAEWNCRHFASYIILGVSRRRYTDEQLKQWREANHKGCEIDGQHYTTYQASQLMRKLETKVRQQKDIANLAKESGDDVLRREAQAKIRDLKAKYAEVSEKSGLRQRTDKMIVQSYIEKPSIRETTKEMDGGAGPVHTIGRIDIEKYRAVSEEIRTDEVVITDERISHIKDHHPNDYERYSAYIEEMLRNPQYILADPVPNTAVILQEFMEANERFRLILRLAVIEDEVYKKNSIITFLKISEKKFKKYLRNKEILYKSE